VEVELHSFLISALGVGEWLTSRPDGFILGKELRYPLNMRPQPQSGSFGGEKSFVPIGIQTLNRTTLSLVTILTTIPRLMNFNIILSFMPTFLKSFFLSFFQVYWYNCLYYAGLLPRSQYPECPATGHLDTGFSWFPRVYKRKLRWFPSFQVATTCFSCSPPDLNFLVTFFIFVYM